MCEKEDGHKGDEYEPKEKPLPRDRRELIPSPPKDRKEIWEEEQEGEVEP